MHDTRSVTYKSSVLLTCSFIDSISFASYPLLASMVCKQLETRGICSRGAQCKATHLPSHCKLCNVAMSDRATFFAHMQGKRHASEVFGSNIKGCVLCKVHFSKDMQGDKSTYSTHIGGKCHRTKLESLVGVCPKNSENANKSSASEKVRYYVLI